MLIIKKMKSGMKMIKCEFESAETADKNPEAIRRQFGELRPVTAYEIIGRFGGAPIILGEYINKRDRDEAFKHFIEAFVHRNCQIYESVEKKNGEVIFRPYRTCNNQADRRHGDS